MSICHTQQKETEFLMSIILCARYVRQLALKDLLLASSHL